MWLVLLGIQSGMERLAQSGATLILSSVVYNPYTIYISILNVNHPSQRTMNFFFFEKEEYRGPRSIEEKSKFNTREVTYTMSINIHLVCAFFSFPIR